MSAESYPMNNSNLAEDADSAFNRAAEFGIFMVAPPPGYYRERVEAYGRQRAEQYMAIVSTAREAVGQESSGSSGTVKKEQTIYGVTCFLELFQYADDTQYKEFQTQLQEFARDTNGGFVDRNHSYRPDHNVTIAYITKTLEQYYDEMLQPAISERILASRLLRADIFMLYQLGIPNKIIAAILGLPANTVSMSYAKFCEDIRDLSPEKLETLSKDKKHAYDQHLQARYGNVSGESLFVAVMTSPVTDDERLLMQIGQPDTNMYLKRVGDFLEHSLSSMEACVVLAGNVVELIDRHADLTRVFDADAESVRDLLVNPLTQNIEIVLGLMAKMLNAEGHIADEHARQFVSRFALLLTGVNPERLTEHQADADRLGNEIYTHMAQYLPNLSANTAIQARYQLHHAGYEMRARWHDTYYAWMNGLVSRSVPEAGVSNGEGVEGFTIDEMLIAQASILRRPTMGHIEDGPTMEADQTPSEPEVMRKKIADEFRGDTKQTPQLVPRLDVYDRGIIGARFNIITSLDATNLPTEFAPNVRRLLGKMNIYPQREAASDISAEDYAKQALDAVVYEFMLASRTHYRKNVTLDPAHELKDLWAVVAAVVLASKGTPKSHKISDAIGQRVDIRTLEWRAVELVRTRQDVWEALNQRLQRIVG